MNKMLTKENIEYLISTIKASKPLNVDFIYDVYEVAYQSILELEQNNILKIGSNINSVSLFYYIVGEYTYSISKRDEDAIKKFVSNETIKLQMASIAADKYMSGEVFRYQPQILGNKYLPPISSLDTYSNFMIKLLEKLPKNKPSETLINDLLNKSVSSIRCILKLLCEGFETEAMVTWRTLHETECILMLLDRYGEPLISKYLKHMKYGIAYRNGLNTQQETDDEFVIIKSEMKDHNLKSKDMKKFIEYGWLYYTDACTQYNFKLNFRDGLEMAAGLQNYSKIYEQSSEIVHSTPMLIYSNKIYYYMLTIISTYESFFRLEKIFSNYCIKDQFHVLMNQYEQMKKIYYPQLQAIYKNEHERFNDLIK